MTVGSGILQLAHAPDPLRLGVQRRAEGLLRSVHALRQVGQGGLDLLALVRKICFDCGGR